VSAYGCDIGPLISRTGKKYGRERVGEKGYDSRVLADEGLHHNDGKLQHKASSAVPFHDMKGVCNIERLEDKSQDQLSFEDSTGRRDKGALA